MAKSVVFSIASAFLALSAAICVANGCRISKDYCMLCPRGQNHVACVPPPSDCSKYSGVSFTQFAPEVQNSIVDLHNKYRNIIASGSQSGFPPAARMASVIWSCELAHLAQKNIEQCRMEHDQCRRIDGNPWIGQNLAWFSSYKVYDDKTAMEKSIALWYEEYQFASVADVEKLSGNIQKIGHFTQMIQDRSVSVGCAAARYKEYKDGPQNIVLTACNYGFANIVGQSVYESSSKPASKCFTGTHPQFNALCSPKESYDISRLIPADK